MPRAIGIEAEHVLLAQLGEDLLKGAGGVLEALDVDPAAAAPVDRRRELADLGGVLGDVTPCRALQEIERLGRDPDPVDQRLAADGDLVHLRRLQETLDVDAVGEQDDHPASLALLEQLQGEKEVVVHRRAAARLDAFDAREELVRIGAPRRVVHDPVGEQEQHRLVERCHAGGERVSAGERGAQRRALHAEARVDEQRGGERHVTVLEGDDGLPAPHVEHLEALALEVECRRSGQGRPGWR